MPKLFGLYIEDTGDYVVAIGENLEQAIENTRSCLEIAPDEDVSIVPWDGTSTDAVELLIDQYGGAAVLSGSL